jgi:hypothetical protein
VDGQQAITILKKAITIPESIRAWRGGDDFAMSPVFRARAIFGCARSARCPTGTAA